MKKLILNYLTILSISALAIICYSGWTAPTSSNTVITYNSWSSTVQVCFNGGNCMHLGYVTEIGNGEWQIGDYYIFDDSDYPEDDLDVWYGSMKIGYFVPADEDLYEFQPF